MIDHETGVGGLIIMLEDGNIEITHEEEGHLLLTIIGARPGSWARIWDTLYRLAAIADDYKAGVPGHEEQIRFFKHGMTP